MLCTPWVIDECEGADAANVPEFVSYPRMIGAMEMLERIKRNVGVYKLRHGEDAWKRAVQSVARHTELAKTVERPISRAYFKLIEIARTTAIVAPRTSLHLCEAPGGFAQAVLSEFPDCARVFVTSLSNAKRTPTASVPCFSNYLLRQAKVALLDAEGGDILLQNVRDAVVNAVTDVDLITADGGIDMDSEPELTEAACAALCACQTEVALRCQAINGTFVLKLFTLEQPVTRELIALLTRNYATVSLLKPNTSHPVNDERYLVCQGFRGLQAPLPTLGDCAVSGYLSRLVDGLNPAWEQSVNTVIVDMAMQQREALLRALSFSCTSPKEARTTPKDRSTTHRRGEFAPDRSSRRPRKYSRSSR